MKGKVRISLIIILLSTMILGLNGVFANDEGTITDYNIKVTYDESAKILNVAEKVKFTNNYDDALTELVLHLYPDSYNDYETMTKISNDSKKGDLLREEIGDIKINKVLITGEEMSFTEDNQILAIKLPKPLKPNESIELNIDFSVKIPNGRDRLGYYKNGISITNWYPIMSIYNCETNTWDTNPFHQIGESNYSNIANYNVTLEVPKDMKVSSTGITKSEEIKGDNKIINIEAEKVRDFVFMMNKDYKVISKEVDGININCYYVLHDGVKNKDKDAEIMLEVVTDAVSFFNETIGKYPYKELDIAETYIRGGAMEYPQLLQMEAYGNLPKDYKESSKLPKALTSAVHEVAHQWWYVAVGNNEFEESFMDESITVFTTAYYFEKNYGKYHGDGVIMGIIDGLEYYPAQKTPFSGSVDEFKNYMDYVFTIYMKGPSLFEKLRLDVGDEQLQEIFKQYYDKYLFKNSSIKEFLKIIEKVSGKEAMLAFENRINSVEYTPIKYKSNEEVKKKMELAKEKIRISNIENQQGKVFESIKLKALKGEKIIIVKPSIMEKLEKEAVDYAIDGVKDSLTQYETATVEVKNSSEVTKGELDNNNIIFFDNILNNKFLNLEDNKPLIEINDGNIVIKSVTIKKDNPMGIYITRHPKALNKLLINVFWEKIESKYQLDDLLYFPNYFIHQQYNYKIENRGGNKTLGIEQ
ncbi:M1 family metallopeptidase [Dethiothermospora halolimnae]|uniref:M1 family metallopeptidase n=1 Tax=Dethiothermospora halolimnae TaxID=3114390 RepID=UPI003CCB7DDF